MDQAHGSVKKGPVVTGPAIVETIVVGSDSAPRAEEFRFAWHVGFWALILAVVILCIWLLSGILLPFVAGIALGYLLDPVADRLQRVGLSRLGAALLMLVVFAVILGLVLFLLVPVLTHQLTALIGALPGYVAKLPQFASELSSRATEGYGAQILDYLGLSGGFSPAELQKTVGDLVGQGLQWLGAFARSLVSGGSALLGILSLLVVMPVVAFYMLLDWDKMVATLDRLIPPRNRADVHAIAHDIDRALAGFVRGQSLVCLFLGLWYGIGLSLIHLNFGLLIGLSAGVLSFIPYVGSLTALILSAIVAIVQGWPHWTLLLLTLAVVLTGQFLEGNILSPKLVGSSVGLHPVWLIFALLAFGSLFGFTGLIMAVPVAAAAGVILRYLVRRYKASELYLAPADIAGTSVPPAVQG
jgi:predicted PurR-regulated permease PerM